MYKQFDIVSLKTTKNIRFLSGPRNNPATPDGRWSVVGVVGQQLMLAKDHTIILVSPDDVVKVAVYNINAIRRMSDGQKEG